MLLPRSSAGHNPKFVFLLILFALIALGLVINFFSLRNGHSDVVLVSEPDAQTHACINANSDSNTTHVLGTHTYRQDGLLEVNEDGPHPIYELIARAEVAWQEKLRGASKTLTEAVREYRRRYGRAPPQGFDLWWNYVQKHNIKLPDEYDSIFHDLEPFWGMNPRDLQSLRTELESKRDSFTIGRMDNGTLGVVNRAVSEENHDRLLKNVGPVLQLLRDVEELLPPFRFVYSPHDSPGLLSDYGVKTATLEAARAQSQIERSALPKTGPVGWLSACSPSSPARRMGLNLTSPPPRPPKKTFIQDHKLTMDPCLHPNLFHHHGQFLSHNRGPGPQTAMFPTFMRCSTMIHHDIRVPSLYGWVEDIMPRKNDPEWNEKTDERLHWRGSATGIWRSTNTRWKQSHRDFLVLFANEMNGTAEVLLPTSSAKEPVGKPKEMRNARLNPALMDIGFSGEPMGCRGQTCTVMKEIYTWKKYQNTAEAGKYRYILDVDGNGWSGRFKRLLTSNALVFKATIYPEWYLDKIVPWVHYVPVQVDLSDLHDALFFFRGDGNGDNAHEDLAHKIAVAGRDWSKGLWRREDLVAYNFRLMLEYARVMSVDRQSMSYREDSEEL